jgi:hypothetical protein
MNTAPLFCPRLQEPECVFSSAALPAFATEPDDEFNPFLSCGTCFVPTLDLSPDEYGVTVNAYASMGEQLPATAPVSLKPVLMKPVKAVTVAPVVQQAPAEFRQLIDCPTCFVPATDLAYVS